MNVTLETQLRLAGLPDPVLEFAFAAPERRYRFDFCWPEKKLAVECQGGVYIRGRHVRAGGYTEDCRKLNLATTLGWRCFWFTSQMVESGEAVKVLGEVLR